MKVSDGNYERLQFIKARGPEKLIQKLNKIEGISEIVQFVVQPDGRHGVWIAMDKPSKKVRLKKPEKLEIALPTQTEEIKK
jgi:hypothetical protein